MVVFPALSNPSISTRISLSFSRALRRMDNIISGREGAVYESTRKAEKKMSWSEE
jgi:hypothetical protein